MPLDNDQHSDQSRLENRPDSLRSRLLSVWETIFDRYINQAMLILVALGTSSAIFIELGDNYKFFAACVGFFCVALTFILGIAGLKRDEKIRALNLKIRALNVKIGDLSLAKQRLENHLDIQKKLTSNILQKSLIVIFSRIQLTNSERISLFMPNEERKNYTIIGRFTTRTSCSNIRNTRYTLYKSLLDRALNHDVNDFFIEELPEFDDPNYLEHLNSRIDEKISSNNKSRMRMRPRSFFLKTIMDDGKQVGVLMLESTSPKIEIKQKILTVLDEENELLQEFIRYKSSPQSIIEQIVQTGF
jgi:hypothetical protein